MRTLLRLYPAAWKVRHLEEVSLMLDDCGFHANPITGSTAIRSAVPRVSDHLCVRSSSR